MPEIKERPILFSAPMVRAILEGRKTVTRRPVKVQPRSRADIGSYGKGQPFIRNPDVTKRNPECPFGKPGDRLWVRETHADIGCRLTYRADLDDGAHCKVAKWTPAIHMFRKHSRILLEITDVRVERLQDISADQCRREGYPADRQAETGGSDMDAWLWFRDLWQQINGPESFGDQGVWVVEFKRVTP